MRCPHRIRCLAAFTLAALTLTGPAHARLAPAASARQAQAPVRGNADVTTLAAVRDLIIPAGLEGGALPGLAALETLATADPASDAYRFAEVTLVRERNRLHEAIDLAIAQATRLLGQTARSGGADPLGVMSFNIRYGTARDGDDAWQHRRDAVGAVIESSGAHVLGVQEALHFQLEELAAALPRYRRIGVGRDDGEQAGEYAAILIDGNRLEVLEQGTFWFSDTPDVPASTSWGNDIPRICTWARLRDRAAGATFYVYNVHWDHVSQASRERSAALLLETIAARAAPADPVLVTGDFNAGESNPAFVALVGSPATPLADTFRALHAEASEVGTFNGFAGTTSGDKIDAVLASPHWQVLAADIVRTSFGGRYPSDHFPVVATVVLR